MRKRELLKVTSEQYEDISFEFAMTTQSEIANIKRRISDGVMETTELEDDVYQTIDILNCEIDQLTNHADKADYIFSACSGILCGLIDSFWVGEFSLSGATDWGQSKVESFVKKVARNQGCASEQLHECVKFLEKKFPFAGDNVTNAFGGGTQHHLRDFSHHPNIIGLCFSLTTQFTEKVYGTDTAGRFVAIEVEDKALIGVDLPWKISLGVISWFFHMVSDIAGSSGSIVNGMYGTGLPGPLVSFIKMISGLPIFQSKTGTNELSKFVSKLFNGTLLGNRNEVGKLTGENIIKFDLRAELGALNEIGKQAIPVLINECLIRLFYFFRRLYLEIKTKPHSDFNSLLAAINWNRCLPFKNKSIIRMLTIAHSTFVSCDVIDAAVRTAISGQYIDTTTFLARMALRINFVGIGRLVIAIGADAGMEMKKSKMEKKKNLEYTKLILLKDASIHYHQASLWLEIKELHDMQLLLDETVAKSVVMIDESIRGTADDMKILPSFRDSINKHNPTLLEDISNYLF